MRIESRSVFVQIGVDSLDKPDFLGKDVCGVIRTYVRITNSRTYVGFKTSRGRRTWAISSRFLVPPRAAPASTALQHTQADSQHVTDDLCQGLLPMKTPVYYQGSLRRMLDEGYSLMVETPALLTDDIGSGQECWAHRINQERGSS